MNFLPINNTKDLDKKTWTLTISHPKGEGRWATEGERVGIFPSIRKYVLDYLDFRESRLKELEIEQCEPLFPNELGNYYHPASFSKMRTRLFKKLGIDGNYKVLRPSFGQRLKNGGASIEAVSKALRHTTVATTERFYARIRTSEAWSELEEVWEKPKVSIMVD